MTRRHRLPNTAQQDQHREDDADTSAAEDVGNGHDEEVCDAEGYDGDAGEHGELAVGEVELGAQEGEHGGDGEGAGYGDPGEEGLGG